MKKTFVAIAVAVMLLEFSSRDNSSCFGSNVNFYYSIPGSIAYGKLIMEFL